MKWRNLFFIISLSFLIPGIFSLLLFGLRPSIDFTGGSLLELRFSQGNNVEELSKNEDFQETLKSNYDYSILQSSGQNDLLIKGKEIDNQTKDNLILTLEQTYGDIEALRFETVGPTLGSELLSKTLVALILVASIITIYVWKQFDELKFGICAILAMLHDSLILLGIFSLLGHFFFIEVDLLVVTALLTTMSFSVHDTIVVYDRIRELKRKNPRISFQEIANAAVIDTLTRSINNSMTIIIMLLSLVILGGESIRFFAIALLIGAITGTYSSTFTAVPLLLLFDEKFKKSKVV